ncbi:DUF3883 domain-containing protein [Candidatus Gracilibacteria bacterium]|nr:DUF3883 domain-containing protein [Candidatus Gracilibacteria bacterium]MCF7856644.1 DUF3883 domain-containing protein [Candidatus Gracilibacteria bacterium]MCF7896961.1 DUF3883 domain-containing protein [Candidatus Gracilibacteria bacterium]
MPEINSKELTLKEYKEEVSVYKNYKEDLYNLQKELHDLKSGEEISPILFGIFYILTLWIFLTNGTSLWESLFYSLFLGGIACLFISAILPDSLNNFFNFGKPNQKKQLYEEAKERIERIEELKEEAHKKIQPFEKAVCDRCQKQLSEFFEQNLYKKRSGSQQFEEALAEFSSTIEEISPINSVLVTSHIPLNEYKEYLKKRTTNHSFQTSKKNEKLASVRDFVKSISESQKQKEAIAPEKLYRTARKIDNWEEINKKRKLTGKKGEEIAFAIEQEFFESIGRKDLAQKVRHIAAEDGDGLGYDVLSFFENGKEKYIEVKSTTTSLSSSFYLSRNELGFLKEHNEDAFIYRVLISGDEPQIKTESSREFLEKNDLIPVQYIVKAK